MSEVLKDLKEMLMCKKTEFQGRKRLLFHLVLIICGIIGGFTGFYARELMPERIFQIFMLCIIGCAVWLSARLIQR